MGFISRQSIRAKASLAVVALIVTVGGILTTASLVVLRQTLRDHAGERLRTLGDQFGETFNASAAAARSRQLAIAQKPEIAAYLETPTPEAREVALAAMAPSVPQPELVLLTELRHRDGRIELSRETPASATILGTGYDQDWSQIVKQVSAFSPRTCLGRFRRAGDVIFFPAVAMVPGNEDAFVVTWRRLGNNAQSRVQLAKILGSEAALYIGNSDDTMWSQIGQPADAPAPSTPGAVFEFDRTGGERVLAVRGIVDGTLWTFAVEFPMRVVEAPARTFLWTVGKVLAACLVVGAMLAWLISFRITHPLAKLTAAANRIARGETASRVDVVREDQFGELATSFNAMAGRVDATKRKLERVVIERTGQLQAAQESLARREKMALIGHLASGVGHEIRNPLGVMSNAVYYLEAIQPDAPPEVRKHLGILRQQIQLSSKIVNDLLELSRTTPAQREPVGVDRLLDERLQRVNGNVTVQADIPPDLPKVIVDPVHAGQVLDNLFSNALQAMTGPESVVSVRARATNDGFVTLEVSDTGPGIPREHFVKIFEPLFTTKARGIGLGLALSKSLAQANGGDLALVSQPGQSATFAFTLPVAEEVV